MSVEMKKLQKGVWGVIDTDDDRVLYVNTKKKPVARWAEEYSAGRMPARFRWKCGVKQLPTQSQPFVILGLRHAGFTWSIMNFIGLWHFVKFDDSRKAIACMQDLGQMFAWAEFYLLNIVDGSSAADSQREGL